MLAALGEASVLSDYALDAKRWMAVCLHVIESDPTHMEEITYEMCPPRSFKYREAIARQASLVPTLQMLGGYGGGWSACTNILKVGRAAPVCVWGGKVLACVGVEGPCVCGREGGLAHEPGHVGLVRLVYACLLKQAMGHEPGMPSRPRARAGARGSRRTRGSLLNHVMGRKPRCSHQTAVVEESELPEGRASAILMYSRVRVEITATTSAILMCSRVRVEITATTSATGGRQPAVEGNRGCPLLGSREPGSC
eukprot:365441-Chlamydomonas_euryale.AAC.22